MVSKGELATTEENSDTSVWSSPPGHLELKVWGWNPGLWAGGKNPRLEGSNLPFSRRLQCFFP